VGGVLCGVLLFFLNMAQKNRVSEGQSYPVEEK
jgi:hypothetical protein